ncbi:hypothetical protein [Flavihumibacter sp. CACIAM 22H1]|uniref:hypothetical protein n=1 Tax=Flavihumibacter sp. CACIAM 22H1 TaxID=1812911 RepID=UPI0007A7E6C9|nr:hypothetical protein [Flavihumibacter sp. CACIAM 22H1]KYP14552.1 MAG: hypothetical protein A1D16_00235 [Flavihumibacter sp. CACIAM 22H1]
MKKLQYFFYGLAIVFLLFQLLAYLSLFNRELPEMEMAEKAGYLLGMHFPLILAAIFYGIALMLKKKLRKNALKHMIHDLASDLQEKK